MQINSNVAANLAAVGGVGVGAGFIASSIESEKDEGAKLLKFGALVGASAGAGVLGIHTMQATSTMSGSYKAMAATAGAMGLGMAAGLLLD